jgi:hypothetical protein
VTIIAPCAAHTPVGGATGASRNGLLGMHPARPLLGGAIRVGVEIDLVTYETFEVRELPTGAVLWLAVGAFDAALKVPPHVWACLRWPTSFACWLSR